ncbi:oocyte zinc finger protein XlCOF26-like [Culicoides brevitarsis]|uniref:oocyte zinc finger protein XlCOF26-like n=1 Tax=Culicoides brevitarsis TaxID=469753 RepID=UPI00307C950B
MIAEKIEENADLSDLKPEILTEDDDEVQLIKVERVENAQNHQKSALQSIINRLKASHSTSNIPSEAKNDPLNIQKYFPCQKCKKILATAQDLVQHLRCHDKKSPSTKIFRCKICSTEFSKQVSFASHMNLHRETLKNEVSTHKCPECGESFRNKGSLWNHKKAKHMPGVRKCNICCKTFATETAFKEHLQKHEAAGPIKCEICQKSFTLQASLVTHMRLHTGELPFLCAECGKSFNTKNRLQEHLRRHQGERRFECSVCLKRFFEKSDLRKHEFTHSDEQKPYSCYYCGKSFIMSSTLQIHIRTHTGEKPYACEFKELCEKRFATRSQMKRHLKVHTGQFPNVLRHGR